MDVSVFFVSVKYGKIPDEERDALLPGVDFSLPEDTDTVMLDWPPD